MSTQKRQKIISILTGQPANMSRAQAEQLADAIMASGGDIKTDPAQYSTAVSKGINKTAEAAKSASAAIAQVVANLSDTKGPLESITQQVAIFRQEQETFFKAGYTDQMFNFKKAIDEASMASFKLTGNFRSFAEASQGLRDNFQALGFVSEDFRSSLMNTATNLAAAGFNMRDYASVVDSATMSFNMSEGQINDMTAALISTQKAFAINPKKMMSDYSFFQKNFAYSADQTMQTFIKLQKMSRTTGVGFGKLAESFGRSMDRFDGSAQMAGRLNQILGKSMFNSIDLLNKTEAERAKTIREGIIQRFGDRVGQLDKFELLAIGQTLNMSADETRRFLRGEPPKAAKDMEKLRKKTPAEIASANLGNELDTLRKGIRGFMMPLERSMIDISFNTRKAALSIAGLENAIDSAIAFSARLAGEESAVIDGRRVTGRAGPDAPGTLSDRIRDADGSASVASVVAGGALRRALESAQRGQLTMPALSTALGAGALELRDLFSDGDKDSFYTNVGEDPALEQVRRLEVQKRAAKLGQPQQPVVGSSPASPGGGGESISDRMMNFFKNFENVVNVTVNVDGSQTGTTTSQHRIKPGQNVNSTNPGSGRR